MEAGRVHLYQRHEDQEDKPSSRCGAHPMGARGRQARPPAESRENEQVRREGMKWFSRSCSLGEWRDSGLGHRSAPCSESP